LKTDIDPPYLPPIDNTNILLKFLMNQNGTKFFDINIKPKQETKFSFFRTEKKPKPKF